MKNKLSIKFYSKPVYNQKYLKAKIREIDDVIKYQKKIWVIRAISIFLIFLLRKDFTRTKKHKTHISKQNQKRLRFYELKNSFGFCYFLYFLCFRPVAFLCFLCFLCIFCFLCFLCFLYFLCFL